MKLVRIAAIMLRQVYLLRGSPQRILPMFAWVGIDIVLWGFMTRYLAAITAPGTAIACSSPSTAGPAAASCASPPTIPTSTP